MSHRGVNATVEPMSRTMRNLLMAVLAAVLLAPVYVTAGPTAQAAERTPDHIVHAGAVDPTDPQSAHMFEAFFPKQLRVHRGDRVRWEFPNQGNAAQGFHTVTFAKDPTETSFVRADEVPGTLAFDEKTFFTSGCGRPGQSVCVISDTEKLVASGTGIQHNSGLGKAHPFDAVIDLPVGTYTYFCALHHPTMVGTIEVVPDDVPISNAKPEDFTDEITAHVHHANAEFAAQAKSTVVNERGRRVWTVDAGGSTDGDIRVVTEKFLPSSLEIRAGDTVRWVMDGTAHTVTFPDTTENGLPPHITLNCETDGRATGAPGVPWSGAGGATPLGLPACPPGTNIEMSVTPQAANQHRARNDEVLPGVLHNSALMIGAHQTERMRGRPPGSGTRFPSTFEARFPVPGTYTYRCLIHWQFMSGSITVR
jgi:plastocyanin